MVRDKEGPNERRAIFLNPLVASGITAALMSERARAVLRRGAVYGLASVMTAGEAVAKSAAQSAEFVASSAGDMAGDLVGEAKEARSGDKGRQPAPRPQSRKRATQRRKTTA